MAARAAILRRLLYIVLTNSSTVAGPLRRRSPNRQKMSRLRNTDHDKTPSTMFTYFIDITEQRKKSAQY